MGLRTMKYYRGEAMVVAGILRGCNRDEVLAQAVDALERIECRTTGLATLTATDALADQWGSTSAAAQEAAYRGTVRDLLVEAATHGQRVIRLGLGRRQVGPMILAVRDLQPGSDLLVDVSFGSDVLGVPLEHRGKEDRSRARWRRRFSTKALDQLSGLPGCLYAAAGNEMILPTPQELLGGTDVPAQPPGRWVVPGLGAMNVWDPLRREPADRDAEARVLDTLRERLHGS